MSMSLTLTAITLEGKREQIRDELRTCREQLDWVIQGAPNTGSDTLARKIAELRGRQSGLAKALEILDGD